MTLKWASFVIAPNRDVYVLHRDGKLTRVRLDVHYEVLETNARFLAIDDGGTVYTVTGFNQVHKYRALDEFYLLPAFQAVEVNAPPSDAEVIQAAGMLKDT